MIEHWYLACMIFVTGPFNWHHVLTLTLTFDLLQGQICCRAGDHNSPNLLVSSSISANITLVSWKLWFWTNSTNCEAFTKVAILFSNVIKSIYCFQKLEGRIASDEDLKLSDTLRYYMRDSNAGKDLLYRRSRSLADYENANKALEKARTKNKEVAQVLGNK